MMYALTGKAVVISDLHLGSVSCLHHQLIHFLETVQSGEYTLLVIAGDLLESTTQNRLDARDWKVLSKLRKMSNDLDIVWLSGNHDNWHPEVLAHLLGIAHYPSDFRIITKSNTIVCLHGHQFDKYISKHPWLTFVLGWIYLSMQRIDRRHTIARTFKRWAKKINQCAPHVKTGALNMYKNDFVICGHTHSPTIKEHYANVGSWTDLRGSYIEIDEDGDTTLKTWQPQLMSDVLHGGEAVCKTVAQA